jgi:hypothetical protein
MNREIDALVAEHIFGWGEVTFNAEINAATGRTPSRTGGMDGRGFAWIPRYSEDIAAAWEVVERMRGEGWSFELLYLKTISKWLCKINGFYDTADTAPMAIALAALKAKGVETEGRE